MSRLSLAATTLVAFLFVAAPASAGDPTMPLSEVRSGMRCEGFSVVRGTTPVAFDVEVDAVIDGDPMLDGARILVAVSGPNVDRTGIGPGFSGSPIYCAGDDGVRRVIGAISESVGEYGGKVALATPIDQVLGVSPVAPAGTPPATTRDRKAPRARKARLRGPIRKLTSPLTVSGLGPALGRSLTAGARRAGTTVLAAPAGPAGAFAPQTLVPGSAMSVALSSGDINVGAVGTVAYVDGPRVWGFGHGFDSSGARSLFLQDAYVFRVINNPSASGDASTYKLAVGGHNLGTVGNDEVSAVAGTLGALPRTIPIHVYGKDADTGRTLESHSLAADETIATPGGASPVSFIAPLAVAKVTSGVLRSAPSHLYGTMCLRITLEEVRSPLRVCNRYVSAGGGGEEGISGASNAIADRAGTDAAEALSIIDSFKFGTLRVKEVSARITLRRGIRQAYLRAVRAPKRVRAGQRIRLRATIQRVRGERVTRTLTVRLPRELDRGSQRLTLQGTDADSGGDLFEELVLSFVEDEDAQSDENGPNTVGQVVRAIKRLNRYDGVRLSLGDPPSAEEALEYAFGEGEDLDLPPSARAYRDDDLRISGRATTRVRVVR